MPLQHVPVAVGHVSGAVSDVVADTFQDQSSVVHQRYERVPAGVKLDRDEAYPLAAVLLVQLRATGVLGVPCLRRQRRSAVDPKTKSRPSRPVRALSAVSSSRSVAVSGAESCPLARDSQTLMTIFPCAWPSPTYRSASATSPNS